MKKRMYQSGCCFLTCIVSAAQGDLTLRIVPMGSSSIAGGQQVTLEVHVESNVDQLVAGGQVDLPCLIDNGSGTLTSLQVAGDTSSTGMPRLCPGGIVAANQNLCRVAQTHPFGNPSCLLLSANEPRYMASITYLVSDCAEGAFVINVEGVSLPPMPFDKTQFQDEDNDLIPIAAVVGGTLTMAEVAVGACCDGEKCLEDGIYAGCCYLTYPGAQFYMARNCEDVNPCSGPCCLSAGACVDLEAGACTAQGGTPQPASIACEASEACCLGIGVCEIRDRSCCIAQGGMPQGAGSSCEEPYACCTQSPERQLFWSEPWTSPSKIKGASLDGLSPATVVTDPERPKGIDVDRTAGKVYWCASGLAPTTIRRSNLDGSGAEDLVSYAGGNASGLALDSQAGKVYWTDTTLHSIQRADFDGSSVVTLYSGSDSPNGIALDPAGETMYWTDDESDAIRRANLDGSGAVSLVTGLPGRPEDIALDLAGGKMYWTESHFADAPPTVNRANLDGSASEILIFTENSPFGIDLDLSAGKMYWAAGKIQRANLDGTGVEDLVSDVSAPYGIALALPLLYGDMDDNQVIDVDDIACVVSGFMNQESCPPSDIHPCGGNNVVDLDDVLTVVDVFMRFGQ